MRGCILRCIERPSSHQFISRNGGCRVANLSFEEITALEVAALYHDYGRMILQNDLGGDTHEMGQKGAQAYYIHLTEKIGIPKEIA